MNNHPCATQLRECSREFGSERVSADGTHLSSEQKNNSNIMIVDDEPANLKLLEAMLRQKGYAVRSFPRGRLALAAARRNPPDLILLDVNMPEMNGHEVCERLKSEPELSRIPVVFLSALSDTADKVKAFRSGASDYITKPFQLDEVQARVETHLELQRLQRALQLHSDHLEKLVGLRTRELTEAHARLEILDKAKSDFLNLISHEFRTPLNGLLGVGELILSELPSAPEARELWDLYDQSRQRILTILDKALLFAQVEARADEFKPVPLQLISLLSIAIDQAAPFARSRHVALSPPRAGTESIFGTADILVKAFQALLETAVKFSNEGEIVRLACRTASDTIEVVIDSCGRTISAAALPRFFDLFSIGETVSPQADVGLDAPLAHRILAIFGGTVSVKNRDADGIRLTVSLKPAH